MKTQDYNTRKPINLIIVRPCSEKNHPGKTRVQVLKALLPQLDAVIDKRLRILNGVLIFNNSYELSDDPSLVKTIIT